MRRLLLFICLLCGQALLHLHAQSINLSASKLKGIKRGGRDIQHLEGNVRFEQNGNTVLCDMADYDVQDEELTGIGNVQIQSSEGVRISGSSLIYSNKTKTARVSGNVKLTDRDMTLTTPWINYNTDTRIGYYGAGGRIVDNEMVLTSGSGTYNPNLRMLYFRKNVFLDHPEYKIKADTLQYNTETGTSYFFTYTEIESDSSTIICNYGEYNQRTGKSYFTKNAAILSKDNIIRADTLSYNRNTGIGEAFGRLWVKDTLQRITIFGNKGYYDRKTRYTRVTGAPLARQYEKNGDSLMLKADTFVHTVDSIQNRRTLIAFHRVALWRVDFSGTADSMSFVSSDSLFRLFGSPVLWNNNNRLSADTMRMYMRNSKISHMQLRGNSFVSTEEEEGLYSQISGTDMNNYFNQENKLKLVHVLGAGKSIYYIKEKDSAVTSANYVVCSSMRIQLDSNKVKAVRFYDKPEGTLYPLDELPADKKSLTGFMWDISNRPISEIFTPKFQIPSLPQKRAETSPNRKRKS
jgi:lipopolysaccharide export system protein LptA